MAACIHSSRTETAHTNSLSRDPNGQIDERIYKYAKFCRPNISDHLSCSQNRQKSTNSIAAVDSVDNDVDGVVDAVDVWLKMREEAKNDVEREPILSSYYSSLVLVHDSLESALSNHLSNKLTSFSLPSNTLFHLFMGVISDDKEIMNCVRYDLRAVRERDPACISFVHCFLNFKGFLACQAHRISHRLWSQGRKTLALLIQSRVSEVFAMDIHPGAKIGRGILLDHATGVVIGETAVIGNNVSILHNVTLGGTGKECGDRHPKIGDGVLIGAGTCILGNISVGEGAKIGAGSVVLKDVPARTTAVGNPARLIGGKESPIMLDKNPSFTMDHTSHMSEWSDYVI
ncbi:Serine acetyltransferase, N-terminal [Dillenia turbinata]|uniref:serine O-acetyltransferase n=1 Tax=Dillenia turbinata TaxID=194707 RepID=A0AAN8W6E4_9MAGN